MTIPRSITRSAIGIVVVAAVLVSAWAAMTAHGMRGNGDLGYILWKHGFVRVQNDDVAYAMYREGDGVELVLNKTLPELRERFGFLVAVRDAAPELQDCVKQADWKDDPAMFIRRTHLLVFFNNGFSERSTDFMFVKTGAACA